MPGIHGFFHGQIEISLSGGWRSIIRRPRHPLLDRAMMLSPPSRINGIPAYFGFAEIRLDGG
jgi:hypothetical protein